MIVQSDQNAVLPELSCASCTWQGMPIDTRMFGKISGLCPECGGTTVPADYDAQALDAIGACAIACADSHPGLCAGIVAQIAPENVDVLEPSPGARPAANAAVREVLKSALAAHRARPLPTPADEQRKIIERAIIGLRDGWATRKDADEALAILAAMDATSEQMGGDAATPAPWKVWGGNNVINEEEGQVCTCETGEDAELIVRLRNASVQMGGAQVAQDREQRARELDDRYRKGYSEGWAEGRSNLAESAAEGEATSERKPLTDAARDVLAERARQINAEGWTTDHDDSHSTGAMALAASVYALGGSSDGRHPGDELTPSITERLWPWDWSWFKPNGRRRNLVKAAALLLAEIERLDRAEQHHGIGSDK